ncbi:GMC oxidoreductase [Amanita muscaria Koide BX008]|uniref:GMC oxidoreductase n=1 Tax=Amanita muscaria (strain Koide BX008) TaxID=946122 RepID=A0A0C2XCI4_AMAMK|nr:GMC oxidoreductase [Amanita muscaria Koide BX008]
MAESSIKVYDIIFAGGGTTACITAGRLAAANPSLKILILEDGPETRNKPDHVQPGRCFANIRNPKTESISFHLARPSQALGGRTVVVPTGRCFGGGSCIDFMMYTRAAASDYDDWEVKYNNPGWGFNDLLPLLQKAETFDRSAPYHGFNGPLKISYRESGINVADDFLATAFKYEKERINADDVNDFFTCNTYGRLPQYSDPATGKRSDTAHHYVYNQIDRNKNLVMMCGKKVVRILFEGTRAVGVEYVEGQGGQKEIAKASLLVVISAGAFGSPAILQRSGIGDAQLLSKHGIKQIVDLPGVGEHYIDHNLATVPYAVSDEAETLDALFRGDQESLLPIVQEWQETGKGPLSHNGIIASIKMRPHRSELPELGEEFQTLWQEHFESSPDKPVVVACLFIAYVGMEDPAASKKFVTALYYTGYPATTGFVHTGSGTDPYSPIDFHSGIFDRSVDIGVMRWAYKRTRELLRRMRMSRGEHVSGHPKFSEGSAAECKATEGPVDIDVPDIAYSTEDDDAIDQFHRETVGSGKDPMGTCGMKPREDRGVVDSRLNVYGTYGLKVADLSICPANVGANTYNTAIAIGEKAAVLIAEDLGIKGV